MVPGEERLRAEIIRQCRARGVGKTVCPSEIARALVGDEAAWRALMPDLRRVAVSMARDGAIEITQKGQIIDPSALKGPIRLGLPG